MDPRRQSPADLCSEYALNRFGVIGRAEALALGMSADAIYRKVASGTWLELLPHTYAVAGTPDTPEQRLLLAQAWAGPAARLSHRSAAALHALSECPHGFIELTTTRSLKSTDGVIVHRVRRVEKHDGMTSDPFVLTTPARTILDLGAVCDFDTVEAALEDALRRRLTTLPALHWQLRTGGGRGVPGTEILRALLEQRPIGYVHTRSDLELKVDRVLRSRRGLPRYVRQYEVLTRGGRRFLDFAFPEHLVGVEAVSYEWHGGRQAWRADIERDRDLRAQGWRLLYVSLEDIRERREGFIADLLSLLSEYGPTLDL